MSQLVNVAAFNTAAEAHAAKNLLEANDIPAFLADEATVGDLWHLGLTLGGIKLQVDADDLQRARRLLSSATRHAVAPPDDVEDVAEEDESMSAASADWFCPKCGEPMSDEFDACWSCGASRDGTEDSDFEPSEEVESGERAFTEGESNVSSETAATLGLIAAVAGIAIFPPVLNLLSGWILWQIPGNQRPLRALIAWAIDLLMCAYVVLHFEEYWPEVHRAIFG